MDEELLNQLLDQSGTVLIISVLVTIGSAVLCGYVAARRGARPVFWAVMGLLFGPFAIPFAFFAKPSIKD